MKKIVEKLNSEEKWGPVGIDRACDIKTWNKFVRKMHRDNAYCPAIEKIVFKTGTVTVNEDVHRTLMTTVHFVDGTKACTSFWEGEAGVKFEQSHAKIDDSRSPLIWVPTFESKRTAVVYAVTQRVFQTPSDEPEHDHYDEAFFEFLNDELCFKEEDVYREEACDEYEKAKKETKEGKELDDEIVDEEVNEEVDDEETDDEEADETGSIQTVVEKMNNIAAQMAELAGTIAAGLTNR